MTLRQAQIQKAIGWVFFLPLTSWPMIYMTRVMKFTFPKLMEYRAQYREWMKDPRPLIICSNHLTYVDSVLLIHAFASHPWYWRNFRCMTWNLPAIEYAQNPIFRVVCYMSKCIFIQRKVSPRHQDQILKICQHYLSKGEPLTIFPEGRRSRTGRFESNKLTNGAAKIISGLDEVRVLCAYVRGDQQVEASKFPAQGSVFNLQMEMLILKDRGRTKEDLKAVTREIGEVISRLEVQHFVSLGMSSVPDSTRAQKAPRPEVEVSL